MGKFDGVIFAQGIKGGCETGVRSIEYSKELQSTLE